MRIHFFDPTGSGLGLAIGLVELGHAVVHRGPCSWNSSEAGDTDRMCRDLVQRYLGAIGDGPGPNESDTGTDECDLVVVVDTFADMLHALTQGVGVNAPMRGDDPLQQTLNPLVYPERLRF
ncbi:MAG: hypothetical protein ABIP94_10960 [Planctomycetota bacterium]